MDSISIRGAKVHNLKNIDVSLPRNKLVVITGLSGSVKSSLALILFMRRVRGDMLSHYLHTQDSFYLLWKSLMWITLKASHQQYLSNKRRHHIILDRPLEPSQKFMTTLDFCLPEWALQDVQTMAMSFKHKLFHRWSTLF